MTVSVNSTRRVWPKQFWIFLCGVLLFDSLRAGEYSVTEWGVDEGLPQSSVTDIAQTPDGFLWVGTLLSGLSRFDGVQFVNFDSANTPALVNGGVRHFFVDSRGNLWVGGSGGLLLRRNNTFIKAGEDLTAVALVGERLGRTVFATQDGELVIGRCGADEQWTWERHQPPFKSSTVSYYEDSGGALWFLAPGGKIGRFVGDQFEILGSPLGLAGQKVQTLARTATGQIWAGTDKGLACWENGMFTNLIPAGTTKNLSVRRITPMADEGLWVEASGKLYLVEHNQWSAPVKGWDGTQAPWSFVRTIHPDNLGGLWVSLRDGLAHVARDGRLTRVTGADGLPSQVVKDFFADRAGNLWTGYHRGGLIQIRKQTFHSVTQREGLLDKIVTSVTEDGSGSIWLGSAGGSVARWADGVCTNFSLPLGGKYCQDAVVATGPDGRVWIGTGGNGLLVYEQGVFRHVILPEQIAPGVQPIAQSIRQLLVAQNGAVWFANLSGLYRLDGTNLHRVLVPNATAQMAAALIQGADGAIWIGTAGGMLRRWQDGKLASYQPEDNVPASRFWALCPEADGTIWVGTMNGGLLRFKDGQFTRFTTADGLADDCISHILSDDFGNLWLGSRAGVMCVAKKLLMPRESRKGPIPCRLFGRSDGLPTVAMTLEFQPSCVKAHNGALWFGSPKGASWVDPDDVRAAEPPPPVLVDSVYADNSAREFSPAGSPASLPQITVEPGMKNVEVRFTSPTFTASDLVRFKYRLDKLDADWTDLGGRRNMTFPHLPAGEYTFRVLAKNSDGLWSRKPAGFRLVMQPYFWERKSFLVGTTIVILGLVVFVVRRITQQRLERKLEALRQQQQIERERARIAQDLHDDLGAGLTEISMTSDLVENPNLPGHETREYAHEVGIRARELVQRMDEIVWAVNPRNDSVASLSAYASEYVQLFLDPLGIACRVEVQPGLPTTQFNAEHRYNFFLAFKETITNVARHSSATEMHLVIHAENGKLVLIITDNGRGFVPGGAKAGADGLRNIHERLTRMGGECEITSQPGHGTRVCLRVPLAPASKN